MRRSILFQATPNAWLKTIDSRLQFLFFFYIFFEPIYRWQAMQQQARDQKPPVVKQKRWAGRVLSCHLAAVPLPETKATHSSWLFRSNKAFYTNLIGSRSFTLNRPTSLADTNFVSSPNYLDLLYIQTETITMLYLNCCQCLFCKDWCPVWYTHFAVSLWLLSSSFAST